MVFFEEDIFSVKKEHVQLRLGVQKSFEILSLRIVVHTGSCTWQFDWVTDIITHGILSFWKRIKNLGVITEGSFPTMSTF